MLTESSTAFFIISVLFWLSAAVIFYSYVVFPFLIQKMAKGKKIKAVSYSEEENLPFLTIIIAAFNEEEVIEQKIRSVITNHYPHDKMEILVGSDNSTDATNTVLEILSAEFSGLQFFAFEQRRGKGNVINELVNHAKGEILVFTDANVLLEKNTLFELVRYFKDTGIGLVDSRMVNTNMHPGGISFQEKAYISREVNIKHHESVLWRTMMGPFGGCFALRKDLYSPVPRNFMVDDFYISMRVFEQGYACINNLGALVYEDVSNNLGDEFRRKIRIATGNFQNLKRFSGLLWHPTKGLSFCLISHKVLRWLGPFFLLTALFSNLYLAVGNQVYFYLLLAHCCLIILPLCDLLLKRMSINIGILRFVTHFYSMNLALLTGFFKSLKNIESNVWKPTQRNQA